MTSSIDCSSSCFYSQHPLLTCPELDSTVSVPREYPHLADQILTDCGAYIDSTRLTLLVDSALEVLTLFFAAAVHEPSQPELHHLFEDFLMRCIVGHRIEEA
jgi:hypothetical protein